MAGPPVMGLTADAVGLPAALVIVCAMTAAVGLLSSVTRPAPPEPSAEVARAG